MIEEERSIVIISTSLCLFAYQQLQAIDKRWKWVPSFVFFSPFFFPYSIQIAWCSAHFVLFFFFFYSSSGYAKQEYRENGDHHISHHIWCHYRHLYESTLDFFADKLILSVLVHHYSSLIYFFFVFDMRARERKNQSYRFVYILDWPLLIQGHHIMFLLTSYSFIQFAL